MGRAKYSSTALTRDGITVTVSPFSTVTVYAAGTTDPYPNPLYENITGVDTLSNPFQTDANGNFSFWLDSLEPIKVEVTETGNGILSEDYARPIPDFADAAFKDTENIFTAKQKFGTGDYPSVWTGGGDDWLTHPVMAEFVSGTNAAPDENIYPAISFGRKLGGNWGDSTNLVGSFNFWSERINPGTLDPTKDILNNDTVVIRIVQSSPSNVQPLATYVVQDNLRGPALFHTDNATTQVDAQRNLSAFLSFFAGQSWNCKEFEMIGFELNVGGYGDANDDAAANYFTGVGRTQWYNNLGALQPAQSGRKVGGSFIGKGRVGLTAGIVIGADPPGGAVGDPGGKITANAALWKTGLDILPVSIWSGYPAIRVLNAGPSLLTMNNQSIQFAKTTYALDTGESNVVNALKVSTANNTLLNAESGLSVYITENFSEVVHFNTTYGVVLPNARKVGYVEAGGAGNFIPALYGNASNDTIINAKTGQSVHIYVNDITLLASMNSTYSLLLPNNRKIGFTDTGAANVGILYGNTNDDTIIDGKTGKNIRHYINGTTLLVTMNTTGTSFGNFDPTYFVDVRQAGNTRSINSANTSTGGGTTNYGVYGGATGSGPAANYGIWGTASGATTNYGLGTDVGLYVGSGADFLKGATSGALTYLSSGGGRRYVQTFASITDDAAAQNCLPNNFTGILTVCFKSTTDNAWYSGLFRVAGFNPATVAPAAISVPAGIFTVGADTDGTVTLVYSGGTLQLRNRRGHTITDVVVIGDGIA